MKHSIRDAIRRRRRDGVRWVAALDAVRELGTAAGRARRWTRLVHRGALHQITEYTEADRYPELFDMAAVLRNDARRILSFGCSTGEELESIRRRFPEALIVGAEINPRSRATAQAKTAGDGHIRVVRSCTREAPFDIVFALAVLQFQPHRIEEAGIDDLAPIYPFDRFEREVARLTDMLRPGGLLCVMHAQYRVEDSASAATLTAVDGSPLLQEPLFGPDCRRLPAGATARSMFIKRPQ